MHVLWTPSWFPTEDAPLNGSFFIEQERMLEEHGLKVGTIFLRPRSLNNLNLRLLKPRVDGHIIRQDFPLIPREVLPFDPLIIKRYAHKLGKLYEQTHGIPDVIHAHSVFPGILVAQTLAQMWKIPFGLTEHRPSSLKNDLTSPRGQAVAEAVRHSAFNITVSWDMAEALGKHYNLTPFIAQALPAPNRFFETPLHQFSDKVFTFLHVSHMDRNKRVEETIAAFAETLTDFPNTHLRLIGGTAERCKELTAYAQSLNILDSVDFVGTVPRSKILNEMTKGDCLVLASEYEAGGTVFAEAQALGIPLIASATAAGRFMANRITGELVPIDDHEALVEAMLRTLRKAQSGEIDSQSIRNFGYERSSEEAFTRLLIDVYSQAIKTTN